MNVVPSVAWRGHIGVRNGITGMVLGSASYLDDDEAGTRTAGGREVHVGLVVGDVKALDRGVDRRRECDGGDES